MADQENSTRMMTRNAKKRALEAIHSQSQKKTRVVLGEISNNIRSDHSSVKDEKPKCKKSKKAKKDSTTVFSDSRNSVFDENVKSSDPQMCDDYVTDIYDYLHNMEVSIIFPNCFFFFFYTLYFV